MKMDIGQELLHCRKKLLAVRLYANEPDDSKELFNSMLEPSLQITTLESAVLDVELALGEIHEQFQKEDEEAST